MALRPMQGERELQSLNQRRQWLDEESPFAYSEGFLCGEVYSSIWGIRAVSATTMWRVRGLQVKVLFTWEFRGAWLWAPFAPSVPSAPNKSGRSLP